jgi:hypothetical protein
MRITTPSRKTMFRLSKAQSSIFMRVGAILTPLVVAVGISPAWADSSGIPVISDSAMQPSTVTIGGADVLPTTNTIPHWWGSMIDASNGVTYGYNMAGANPAGCAESECSVSITVDIVPINVIVGGREFDGTDVVDATIASPQFALNDYGSATSATSASWSRGVGGVLSQGDAGNSLQLQDATMRAQFNQTGASPYHLILNPVIHDPITIVVPGNHGVLLQSGRGVVFADIDIQWWATRIQNLNSSLDYVDPTHLPMYLTNNVMLFTAKNPNNCCVIGFHGAGKVNGSGLGSVEGQGDQPVQTYVWASWIQPGIYSRPDGGIYWALQDIHGLSHEVAEWADDPFINNSVQPWLTPTAPQYGCTGILETGDPVVGIGFAMGANSYDQGPNPNGTQSADGYYHPEDEALLPWFMRSSPNTASEPTQSTSTNVGRYTFMGDLNPFAGFRQPATGC